MKLLLKAPLVGAVAAGVAFQVGHFAEHAYQWGHWLIADRTKPWMSDAANWLTMQIGVLADCGSKLGMEWLHFAGNSIFLATLVGLVVLLPHNKRMWQALGVEAFHLTEHMMLVMSVAAVGKPMGWSTLFGFAPDLMGANGAVGYRVTWHFALNMVPTMLMMQALVPIIRQRLEDMELWQTVAP